MEQQLAELLTTLHHATRPADVFGALGGDRPAALKRRYRELLAAAHPDRHPRDAAAANDAFRQIRAWHAAAEQELARGIYGAVPSVSVQGRLHSYASDAPPLAGDLCDIFAANAAGERVLLKVVRNARNNDLLAAETRALRTLDRTLAGRPVRAHFPVLIEALTLRDAAGAQRQANVLRAERDYVSLADVIAAHPRGIAAADAAWMFNRLLAALACAHAHGIVHGAVTPAHLLVRPRDHNGMLIDWCYSVAPGEPIKAISRAYAADYPPEVPARGAATPASDLFMAARCMARLLGGDGDAETLPPGVPTPIRALLRGCLLPSPHRRAADAWGVFGDFRAILERLYGAPQFRPFAMPV